MEQPRTSGRVPAAANPAGRRLRLSRFAWLVAAVAVAAATFGITLGLRGQATNAPGDPADLRADLQATTSLVVYSEFGEESDTIWAANPDSPGERRQLASVPHAFGYGIGPSLSPDGRYVAYVALTPGLRDASNQSPAQLWLLETLGGAPRLLAEGVDLLGTPVWARDGASVVVRRVQWREDGVTSGLLRVDLTGHLTPLVSSEGALFPIDFSPDGAWLYYATMSNAGSDLSRVPATGVASVPLAHLSDGVSRDWRLSPDGASLAYLGQAPEGATTAYVAQVLDLATGQISTPEPDATVAQFTGAWAPDGELTLGQLKDGEGQPLRLKNTAVAGVLQPPSRGFDVPIDWSPDGAHLAVRSFEGTSPDEPGRSFVDMVGTDGEREQLSSSSDVVIAGWLP
jgi:Tol biopolymer transport system component